MVSDLEASLKIELAKSLASSWEEVVKIYEREQRAHKIKISQSGNTALHIAVSCEQEDTVEQLVKSIAKNGHLWDVLSIENGDGNNPLHLAASLGSRSMCKCITDECKELLGRRNREGDTPLLRAVRYGKKEAFLWLYSMCEGNTATGYCKNDDGKNVLHLAIEGGHMDLAFQIIQKEEDLMDSFDREGISPLHVLAEKPTAFRSGIHFSLLNKIMYHCIFVEELVPGAPKAKKNIFQELQKMIKLPGKSKKHLDQENPEEGQGIELHGHNSSNIGAQGHIPFPSKYGRCLRFIKLLVSQVLLVIISVLPALETPILVASKNGIMEMVTKILELFPMAINDTHKENWKNTVLMAVENRQSHIYDFLLNRKHLLDREIAFRAVDYRKNTALHLAGKLAGYHHRQHIPTSMLQMQWEVKWYQYVQNSVQFDIRKNRDECTPDEIFQKNHANLEDESKRWIDSTSNSCSFIAALIATVAFASSASVPGGVNQETGVPILLHHLAFSIFAMSSLLALSCSMISLLIFLAIFVSKDQNQDFTRNLPRKFLLGLTSLFISIAAMLTCFCSGNFLMLKHQLKYAAIPVYALTGLVMAYFVLKHFPLFIDLMKATFRKVPERIYKEYL
ncbi:ankyrin repeat-containing protein ITN1-like isoform X2 [Vitis riparia]|uniref:ankyrin repeat-containing protein ITN1-like isoform X2 n=1 Tax=Vitis riparia TaxID=96939 RepID=UPI00155A164B|nr:ankyrin repeat-containing protein ITN1-like isoform X2 [Vitis riparia]